jgi:hypothetical protein
MIRALSLLFSLLLASAAAAQQVNIHSVSPSSASTAGGTEVTITGTGFVAQCGPITCIPPRVFFGGVQATETRVVNDTTIVAVTPPHIPGTVTILYRQEAHAPILQSAFTFTGDIPDAYTRLLLPILAPPVSGAFGSEFHTSLTMMTKRDELQFWGLKVDYGCRVLCIPLEDPLRIVPTEVLGPESIEYNGKPGRFFYLSTFDTEQLAANLRVHDVTRAALNYGTEIPIVRQDQFAEKIVLNGVPVDPRFRLTLRIYGMYTPSAEVTIAGQTRTVMMRQGESIYEPDYGELTIDQPQAGPFQVVVEGPLPPLDPPPPDPLARRQVWAFITVTNNETQVISTITPQP